MMERNFHLDERMANSRQILCFSQNEMLLLSEWFRFEFGIASDDKLFTRRMMNKFEIEN